MWGQWAFALEAVPHKSVYVGGVSADSCEGSAPHYEVFVSLRGLRNLSEENRDKVNKTGTGYACTTPPRAVGTGTDRVKEGREEKLPGVLGGEG